jgi:hypothetical protein
MACIGGAGWLKLLDPCDYLNPVIRVMLLQGNTCIDAAQGLYQQLTDG